MSDLSKAWFSYVGKIPDDRGFSFLPTIPDFADISDIRQKSVPDFPDYEFGGRETPCLFVQPFRRLVIMSEIHCRRTPTSPAVQIWVFICREWSPIIAETGTRRENRNAPDSADLSPFIPDDRGYLRFRVFISRQNLGRSGNSKIPDRLRFSRHMKTRL